MHVLHILIMFIVQFSCSIPNHWRSQRVAASPWFGFCAVTQKKILYEQKAGKE